MKARGSAVFALFLLVVCLFFALGSVRYHGMAGFVPLVLAVPTALLTVVVLIGERFPSLTRYFEIGLEDLLSTPSGGEEGPAASPPRAAETRLIIQTFGSFAAFAVIVFVGGFYLAAALFALPFMRFQGRIGWTGAVAVTVLVETFFYVVFEQVLNVALFKGIIFGGSVPPF